MEVQSVVSGRLSFIINVAQVLDFKKSFVSINKIREKLYAFGRQKYPIPPPPQKEKMVHA